MRVLPTLLHGLIDYAWGVLLLLAPFLFGFAADRAAFWTAIIFGLGAVAYSLLTDYEFGVVRLVPVPVHLAIDAVAGIALALTPFVFGMPGQALWPFVLLGVFAVVASLVTRTEPSRPALSGAATVR